MVYNSIIVLKELNFTYSIIFFNCEINYVKNK